MIIDTENRVEAVRGDRIGRLGEKGEETKPHKKLIDMDDIVMTARGEGGSEGKKRVKGV